MDVGMCGYICARVRVYAPCTVLRFWFCGLSFVGVLGVVFGCLGLGVWRNVN